MLGYGSDEFLSGIDLEVFPVLSFFHPSLVDDFIGFLNEFDLLDVENIPYDVLGNGFPALCILPFNTDTVINTETAMTPCHEFSDQFVCDNGM